MSTAFLLVNPELGISIQEITDNYPEIKEIRKVTGDYAYLFRLETSDPEMMKKSIRDIRHSFDVRSTICLLSVD